MIDLRLNRVAALVLLVGVFGAASVLAQDPSCSDDFDGDGYISLACGGNDCNDDDADIYPGATEVCDVANKDEDCDPATFGERDTDGDGFIDALCCNYDERLDKQYCGNDCNDRWPSVHPIASEACDGLDNNCDGVVDEYAEVQYEDFDLDGHGNPAANAGRVCPGTAGYSPLANDCDDSNPAIEPGDIVCTGEAADSYKYCTDNGQWMTSLRCVDGSVCIPQDNGRGVCVPEKLDEKKGNKA